MDQNITMLDIEDRLISMLSKQLKISRESLSRDSTLESIGLDSLATIEFIFEIEDTFGINFDENSPPPKTLGDVFNEIANCMQKSVVHT